MKVRKFIKLSITAVAMLFLLYAFGLESFFVDSASSGRVEFSLMRLVIGFLVVVMLTVFASMFFFMEDADSWRSKGFDALDHQKHRGIGNAAFDPTAIDHVATSNQDFYGNRDGFPAYDQVEGQVVYGKL